MTEAVGRALLRRGVGHGDRLLARAFAVADPGQRDHLAWILAAREPRPLG
ncbi:hypothetical protein [Jiangella ureilytica]|nr:hypothetical protein [Jiangella ureilytica]